MSNLQKLLERCAKLGVAVFYADRAEVKRWNTALPHPAAPYRAGWYWTQSAVRPPLSVPNGPFGTRTDAATNALRSFD
jgi:hypothetical protein